MVQVSARSGGAEAAQALRPYVLTVPVGSGGCATFILAGVPVDLYAGIQQSDLAVICLAVGLICVVLAVIIAGGSVAAAHQRAQSTQQSAAGLSG